MPSLPLPLAATGPEQIILALLFLAGGFLNFVFKKGGLLDTWKQRRAAAPPRDLRPGSAALPPANAEEQRVRKLLEALGHAPGRSPPAIPGRQPPPLLSPFPGTAGKPPPPRPSAPPPTPPTPALPLPVPVLASPRREPPAPDGSASFPARRPGAPLPLAASVSRPRQAAARQFSAELRAVLRGSPGELRRAILLQEILGPPRSLSERGASRAE